MREECTGPLDATETCGLGQRIISHSHSNLLLVGAAPQLGRVRADTKASFSAVLIARGSGKESG